MTSKPFPISIRTVLVAWMLAVALAPAVLIGAVGVYSINKSVRSAAQSRVNQDLEIVMTSYREQLARLAYSLEISSSRVSLAADPPLFALYLPLPLASWYRGRRARYRREERL